MKSISHTQAQTFIQSEADGRLSLYDRVALEAHLTECAICQNYAVNVREAARRLAQSVDTQRHSQPVPTAPRWHEIEALAEKRQAQGGRRLAVGAAVILVTVGVGIYYLLTTQAATPPIISTQITATATQTLTSTMSAPAIRYSQVDGMPSVLVPGGTFLRGTTTRDLANVIAVCPNCSDLDFNDETPAREIQVSDFWIDQTEITNQQYARCVAMGGCTQPNTNLPQLTVFDYGVTYNRPGYAGYPVTGVTWAQANTYCQWTGRRLPTEAEWERAARGPNNTLYPWGETPPPDSVTQFQLRRLSPVGALELDVSGFGVYDMASNVAEWVQDWHAAEAYATAEAFNPTGPITGEMKVRRGGSWLWPFTLVGARATTRIATNPQRTAPDIGFRCAVSQKQGALLSQQPPSLSRDDPIGGSTGRIAFAQYDLVELFLSGPGIDTPPPSSTYVLNPYTVQADGAELTRHHTDLWGLTGIFWSAHGESLALPGVLPNALLELSMDGSSYTHSLPHTISRTAVTDLAWSPEGSKLAATMQHESKSSVYLLGDSASLLLLPNESNLVSSFGARWSPDGQWVTLNIWDRIAETWQLVVIQPGASELQMLDDDVGLDDPENYGYIPFMNWTPDNKSIIYLAHNPVRGSLVLRRASLETGRWREITPLLLGKDARPLAFALSPDGHTALVTYNTPDRLIPSVMMVDIEAETTQVVVLSTLDTTELWVGYPAFSPDGEWVAFIGGNDTVGGMQLLTDLYVAPTAGFVDGTALPVRLTNSTTVERFVAWQP